MALGRMAAFLNYLAVNHGCPELQILQEAADASKHHFADEKYAGRRLVTAATDAVYFDEGELYIRGWNRRFCDVLTKVVTFWRTWLGLP